MSHSGLAVPQIEEAASAGLELAKAIALEVLVAQRDRTAHLLADYYDVTGEFPGNMFSEFGQQDRYDISAADLLAATLMGVAISPASARNLVGPGATNRWLRTELRNVADTDLTMATDSTFVAMESLLNAAQTVLPAEIRVDRPVWWPAAVFCARKRPDLYPIVDNSCAQFLRIRQPKDHLEVWRVFQHLLGDHAVIVALEDASDHAMRVSPRAQVHVETSRLARLAMAMRLAASDSCGTH